jgi:hypothetical protein
MSAEELDNRLDQIDGYSKALVHAIRIMNERRFVLFTLLDDEELKNYFESAFRDRHGAYAFNHLVPLLSQDLVRNCARIFLDDHKKACSLVNIHRKVSAIDALTEFRSRFRGIPDKFNLGHVDIAGVTQEEARVFVEDWKEQGRDGYESDFNQTWDEVTNFVENLDDDEIASSIKTFRDKHHAHLEMQPLGSEPKPFDVGELGLTFNDLFGFIDRCMEMSFKLTRIITGVSENIDGFNEIHKKCSRDMWNILAGRASGS